MMVREHGTGRAGGDQAAGQQEQVVGARGIAEVVGGDDHRLPRCPLLGDDLEDVLARHEVESGDRLVEQQDLGLLGQPLRHECPLPLTAGELVEGPLGEVAEAQRLQGAVDGGPVGGPEPPQQTRAGVAAHRHGLPDGEREPLADDRALQDVGHATGGRRYREATGTRWQQPGQRVEERRLAGAVRTDERRHGGARDGEGGVREHHVIAVGQDEPFGRGHRRSGGRSDLRSIAPRRNFLSMRTVLSHRLLAVFLGTILVAPGCGDDDAASRSADVVVTTSILGDIVEELVGDAVEVEVVMPPGVDPHDFSPSPQKAAAMRAADLLVVNGLGFEGGLDDTVDAAAADGAVVVEVAELAPRHLTADGDAAGSEHEGEDEHDHEEEDGHAHEGEDPHVFTDPARMAVAVAALAEELDEHVTALDGAGLGRRAARYVAELEALDAEVEALLAPIPPERRVLVTNHDVLGYFADRYGFAVVGTVIPSLSTLAEPSAQDLAELVGTIRARGVPAVFAEASSPQRLAAALADEGLDVEVVELHTESLADVGPAATYLGMVRDNARRIAAALA
jgi:zinc/manganese transport system substrate-binding protein